MVCTYKRPDHFQRFLQSVAKLSIPENTGFHMAVCDNNAESHFDRYIRNALTQLPFSYSYGHEPAAGYSNARNKALELALATQAELFAFSDDDMELDPGWLEGHLRSFEEFDCDIIGGAIEGQVQSGQPRRRWQHGEECGTQGAGNVSFRRWIAAPDGIGLRFDPQFNKLGREDQAFFTAAREQGARIIFSSYPVIFDPAMTGSDWRDELANKADVSAVMQRNDIVKIRKERGYLWALLGALWNVRFGAKFLVAQSERALYFLLGQARRAEAKRLTAYKNMRKMVESFRGLKGDYVARSDVRR